MLDATTWPGINTSSNFEIPVDSIYPNENSANNENKIRVAISDSITPQWRIGAEHM